jgi:hypothetical protein
MSARKRVAVALLLALPALTSCRLFRKPKPVPRPFKLPVQTRPAPAPPALLEPPPEIPPDTTAQGPATLPHQEPPLPAPPPARKTPPRFAAPAAEAPQAATPAPLLVPVLTPAQRQELERSVNERTSRAQRVLASIAGRRLSREQAELAGQIRTFLKQAEEARGTDLLRANNLAERAEVLAEDLALRLR